MTRFDAEGPSARRKLFADAITAHRVRGSAFLTIEADATARTEDGTTADGEPFPQGSDGPADRETAGSAVAPWIQFAEDTFNLDCTDAELDRLKRLVDEYPEFRIERLESPEDVEGTNVRISARSDPNRLGSFIEAVFRNVYELPEDYRGWVVEI